MAGRTRSASATLTDGRKPKAGTHARRVHISQRIYVQVVDGWSPIPAWARFFILFGSAITLADTSRTRIIAAISTPTRAYAAPLCAAGIVLERAKVPVDAGWEQHLAMLRRLPRGTTVSFRTGPSGEGVGKGILLGCIHEAGKEYVRIRYGRNDYHMVPVERAHAIEVASMDPEKLPDKPRLRRVAGAAGLMAALSDRDVNEFVTHSRLECALIGNVSVLREEIMEVAFQSRGNHGETYVGQLQSILRVREFGESGQSYRSRVVPSGSKPSTAVIQSDPPIVIFDGSRSFLRWASVWPAANWIVILDRTDRRFSEAVATINADFAARGAESSMPYLPPPPGGVEYVAFQIRRGKS